MTVHSAPGCPGAIQPTMTIEFAPGYDTDLTGQGGDTLIAGGKVIAGVTLAALVDRRWIFCVVPLDTLRDAFGATGPEDAIRVFEENRSEIETLMRSRILAGCISANDEALLSAEMVASGRQKRNV